MLSTRCGGRAKTSRGCRRSRGSETYPDLTRVLAAEVLRAKDAQDGSPAELYVRALALTGLAEDRAPDFMGNAWGFMYDADRRGGDTYGSLGPRLIDAGDAAVPALARLLDDSRRMLYVGSQDATLGNSLGYRVKDAAAYYIGKIRGVDVPFHDSPQERDEKSTGSEPLSRSRPVPDDDLRSLEQQVERGNLFTHSALATQAERVNENEVIINGLVDYLVSQGLVETARLEAAVNTARAERREQLTVGVALRIDSPDPPKERAINCAERLPICHAVCCRLRFALSSEEVEAGPLQWDLGQPYFNRQSDGYCHCSDASSHACTIYDDRPSVCRAYSCAEDPRIWSDFAAMELNHEWIDENLDSSGLAFVEILMGDVVWLSPLHRNSLR